MRLFAFPLLFAIAGNVITPDGVPVPNARVSAYRTETSVMTLRRIVAGTARSPIASATTDQHGAFKLDAGSGVVELDIDADGFAPSASLVPGDEQSVSIALEKAETVEKTVVANGKPVAGAVIVGMPYLFRELAKSDAAGHVRIPNERPVWVSAMHRDFAPEQVGDGKTIELTAGFVMHGKVLDEHEAPVANATVIEDESWLTTTGDDGGFVLPHARPHAALRVISERGAAMVTAGTGDVLIRLKPPVKFSGVLRDEAKNPIAGMLVFAMAQNGWSGSAITDAKGAYAMIVPPGRYWLRASAEPYFQSESVEIPANGTRDLTLKRRAVIAGIVRDDEGKPVGGAHIAFDEEQEGGMRIMRTTPERTVVGAAIADASGHFLVRLAAGSKGTLQASKNPMPPASSAAFTVPAGGMRDLVLTMPRGLEVKGVVTDRAGHPLGDVSIQDGRATTADDGSFSIRMVPGAASLSFVKKGFNPSDVDVDVQPAMKPLAVSLSNSAQVRGTLVHKDGKPAGNLMLADFDTRNFVLVKEDGSFELEFPEPGTYALQIVPGGKRVVVEAPAEKARIVVDEGVSIHGRVTDAATGAPIEQFMAWVETEGDPLRGGMSERDAEKPGEFVVNGLDPGRVTVAVSAEGYVEGRVSAEAGQAEPVAIALGRGVTLHGRVHDSAGKPIEDVRITPEGTFSSHGPGFLASKSDGTFEIEHVPADRQMTLSFHKKGWIDRDVRVQPSKTRETLDVLLASGLSVKGHVVDTAGKPVPDIDVSAETAVFSGRGGEPAKSDASGAFELDGLVPGHYDIVAGEEGSALSGRVRDVDIERVHDVTIRLERRPSGIVAGRITGMSAQPVFGFVRIELAEGSMSGATGSNGTFRIENVPVGTVTVSATAGGIGGGTRTTRAATVDVTAGAVAQVELTFEEQRVLRGHVTHDGNPVRHAQLEFVGSNYDATRATTADDGTYEVHLDPDRYRVRLTGSDGAPFSYKGEVDVRSTSTFDIAFEGMMARVRVVDDRSGEPVEGATVSVEERKLTTDHDGRATIEIARGAKVTMLVSKEGYANAAVASIDGWAEARLVRSPGATIRIVDARDGRTLSGYTVARDASGRVVASAREAEPDGTFALPVAPGQYRFSASAEGYGSETVRAAVPSGEVRIILPRGGKLQLRSNEDVHGTARLLLPDGDVYVRCWCNGVAEVEMSGKLTTIEAISPGSYTLEFTPSGGKAKTYPVTVVEGETTPVQLD